MPAPAATLPSLLKVLSDPTRLRILALLGEAELSVGELSRSLDMAQSRVSNHLRVLRDSRLLAERHAGTSTFLRLALGDGRDTLPAYATQLWATVQPAIEQLGERAGDRMRLAAVLSERRAASRDFFDRVAGEWDKIGARFSTGQARQRALAAVLPPGLVLADLGCGTGYFARAMLGIAAKVICVDRSPRMLEEAAIRLAEHAPDAEIDLRHGELDDLPLRDGEADGAIAALVLHHLPSPDAALAEMFRVVRPSGSAVIVELAPHREEWAQEELGDLHLGLESGEVAAALARAGFVDLRLEALDDRYCPLRGEGSQERAPRAITEHEPKNGRASAEPALPLYLVRGRVPGPSTPATTQPSRGAQLHDPR